MKSIVLYGLLILIFLAGCDEANTKVSDNNQQKNIPIQDDIIHEETTETGQLLRVFSAYEYVDQYVKKAVNLDSNERDQLWQELVMANIQEACLSGEYAHLVLDYVTNPPEDLEKLKNDITMLRASNAEETSLQALKKSAKALPGPDTTVCLLPSGSLDLAGVNLGAGTISVFYFPYFNKKSLEQTVAHEYHHSTWTAKYAGDYDWNVLGSIIFEGKAEYFASLLYGTPYLESFSSMSDEAELEAWNRVKDSIHLNDGNYVDRVLFGNGKQIPYSFGYLAGYHIVQEYAQHHPQATIEEWTMMSPEEIYEKSKYEASLTNKQ